MGQVSVPEAIEMLAEVTDARDVSAATPFGDLGLDSLKSIEWLTLLEDHLGIQFDLRNLDFHRFGRMSVGEVVDSLLAQLPAAGR